MLTWRPTTPTGPHRGQGMEGRTPYEVFKAGIPAKSPARKKPARKEVKTQRRWTTKKATRRQFSTCRIVFGLGTGTSMLHHQSRRDFHFRPNYWQG